MQENMSRHTHMAVPDNTAVRTALWRALLLEVDAPPHVFEDDEFKVRQQSHAEPSEFTQSGYCGKSDEPCSNEAN